MSSKGSIPKKKKELTLEDSLVSFSFDQTNLRNVTETNIMKKSNIPLGFEQHRKLPEAKNKKKKEHYEISEEIQKDLEVLQMRSVFDKKRFYKKNDIKLSKEIKVGRVLDNPIDFYSSRLPKKMRKKSLVDELLSDVMFKKQIKKSYVKIVAEQKFSNRSRFNKWRKQFSKDQSK